MLPDVPVVPDAQQLPEVEDVARDIAPLVKGYNVGIEPLGSASRAHFVQFIRDDMARWAKIVKDANISIQ